MKENLIWAKSSIFANRSQWADVLQNGIRPFVGDDGNKKLIEELKIEFNYLGGENIRLAILTKIQNVEMLAIKLDDFFRNFLLLVNNSNKEIKLPIKDIFFPFPSNSIQYGLYDLQASANNVVNKLCSQISTCMIEAFDDGEIDGELLITFAFYLHSAFLTQLLPLRLKPVLLGLYNSDSYKLKKETVTEEYIAERFMENKATLIDIFESIRSNDVLGSSENPSWLDGWIKHCNEIVNSLDSNHSILYAIRDNINNQLGLTDNMILVIYHFIANVFADYQ